MQNTCACEGAEGSAAEVAQYTGSEPQTTLDDIPANVFRHYPQYKKGAFKLTL